MIIGNKSKGGKEWGSQARKAEGKFFRGAARNAAISESLADLEASQEEEAVATEAQLDAELDAIEADETVCPTCDGPCFEWDVEGVSCLPVDRECRVCSDSTGDVEQDVCSLCENLTINVEAC